MYRGYASGPFGQIHFQDTGTGIPLVLCHQAPMSLRQFDKVYPLLATNGIRAIGIDSPGFGLSDPTDFVPEIKDYARAVPHVLDHLEIEAAFVLGHHTGALIATEVALQFGGRVLGLVLNGPLPLSAEQRRQGLAYVENFEKTFQGRPDGQHFIALFKNRMAYANEDTDWNAATRYVAQQLLGLGPFWYGHHAAFQYDHTATLALLDHPTLVLTNTGDAIYQNAQDTMRLRPDFAYAEINGGSIDIVDERSSEWVELVSKFVHETQRDRLK